MNEITFSITIATSTNLAEFRDLELKELFESLFIKNNGRLTNNENQLNLDFFDLSKLKVKPIVLGNP